MAEVLLPELSVESLGQRESAHEEERSMSSELLTARNLLSRAAGLLEFHAERGSAVAANLNKEITDFLWPEESRDNPTLESKVIPEGAGSMPAAGRWPPRIALTVERPGPEYRLSTELFHGTQCGEPCGTVEGHGEEGYPLKPELASPLGKAEPDVLALQNTGAVTNGHDLASGYQAPPAGEKLRVEVGEYVALVERANLNLSPIRIYEDDGA